MEQRRLLLALALSLVVLFVYQRVVLRMYEAPAPEGQPGDRTASAPDRPSAPEPPPALPAATEPAPQPPRGETVTVDTDVVHASFTSGGARLVGLQLKRFHKTIGQPEPLELVGSGPYLPLALQLDAGTTDADLEYRPDRRDLSVRGSARGEVVFTAERPDGLRITKRYVFTGDGYFFELVINVSRPPSASLGPVLTPMPVTPEEASHLTGIALAGTRLSNTALTDIPADPEPIANARWIGFAAQYFLVALVSDTPGSLGLLETVTFKHPEAGAPDLVSVPVATLRSTSGAEARFGVYMGPKDRESLAAAGHDLGRALDFGWFWFIAVPLLYGLRWLYGVLGNYGLAIIVLTTVVKLATIPLTQATFRSMREMQKLQPEMLKLRERYKDDPSALQKEVMELYRRHRLNPFSGCLTMLPQIPIFIGLYNALMYAIDLRHAPFALWITDLSTPDRLHVVLPALGSIGIPVLTLLMGASMLLQQWLAPQQGDPTQQRLMMIMPVIFTYMFIHFPSGLVLYWLVNNVISIAQQYYMLHKT